MTAPNHAITGAVIGLAITNPWLAIPAAFVSHFVLDAIPHYDPPGDGVDSMRSKRFIYEFLIVGALGCALIVLLLALAHPQHWLQAAFCAFIATSPDLLWIPRYVYVKKNGHDIDFRKANWFWRLHHYIQWKTSERLAGFEAVWFIGFAAILLSQL